MLTRSNGKRILRVGKMDGIFRPDGVEKNRYRKPVIAAKDDWIVFRTIEKVKRSVGGSGSAALGARMGYETVVIASCRTPQERLREGQFMRRNSMSLENTYKEA